ncbi:MAG: VWA domain-containing protein [Acidobacteria bacterium]|nr:VWA domain-containing protein [Acidobacteriota bacterium]
MRALIVSTALLLMAPGLSGAGVRGQAVATFRSSVDLVRVAAIVRDSRGRFVQDLTARDFEVLDDGRPRPIADFQRDLPGVSVALLFDVSGSMEGRLPHAREAAGHLMNWLEERDEAAVFTFDTRLNELASFTTGLRVLPESMARVTPFGETSLHDAIAQTASRAGRREGLRRAIVVFTDGLDTSSRLKPSEASGIASQVDVPVYVVGIVRSIDNPEGETTTKSAERAALAGSIASLAAWTGGHVFLASTASQRSLAARRIIDELRHQYLIAIEASGGSGWHPLEVRVRQKDLVVRARSGYIAGQSRPSSE